MRQAFTMIELVFVIVILGILAVVAVPKLSATRDDARISAMAHTLSAATTEIASYATAQGTLPDDLGEASNNLRVLETKGEAVLGSKTAVIRMGSIDNCMTIEVNSTAESEVLNILLGSHHNDAMCEGLQERFNTNNYPMKLRGQSVSY